MIVEIDKELEEVFPRYLRNREEDMLKLQTAVERKDFETLRHIGHKVAGNAAGYGLIEFGILSRDLEDAAKDRQYEKCRDVVRRMASYLATLQPKFV